MAQGSKSSIGGGGGLIVPTSKSVETLSMDTLLGHLTSGIGSQGTSSRNVVGNKGVSKVKKLTTSNRNALTSTNSKGSGARVSTGGSASSVLPHSIQVTGTMDDLSNLNLLSTLVAAVAASQSTATPTLSQPSTTAAGSIPISSPKTSVGQPSNFHSSKTELRRLPPEVVATSSSANTASNRNVYRVTSSSSVDNSNTSSVTTSLSYPPMSTPRENPASSITSFFSNEKQQEHDREVDKLIAASSSIKKNVSNVTSMHGYAGGTSPSSVVDDLPRSVVRTGLGTLANDLSLSTTINVSSSENDMTASLASIIPSYNSSIGSQSSLLLYTRSLSFPLSMTSEPVTEEEDHLESATRGISELSKLLGTDNAPDPGANTRHKSPTYKDLSPWNPSDLLSNSTSESNDFVTSSDVSAANSGKPYLSGLLESQIHGTVHHASLAIPPKLTNSTSNSTRESRETTLDIDHSR